MSDTSTKPKYQLTPEHREQLKPWADKWIANAMSTKPMTADDKLDCIEYVKQMYKAADLAEPTEILFVPSTFALVVVGGFAAAIDHLGKESKYTIQEMTKIVLDSVDVSKNDLTKWYVNGYDVRALNTKLGLGEIGIQCVKNAHGMWNGGNQWSGWISYISFFRYIAKLDIDYSKWDCYEKLAELSGPRLVHKSFCIICDRPSVLTVDAQNRPHNDTGPFTKWSDGCGMYSVHNVRVPAYIIEKPERITVELIEAEQNAEVRRVMIDKYGREKFIVDSKSEVVHQDDFGTLYVKKLAGDEDMMMVKVVNSTPEPDGTFKDYFIRCDPKAYGGLKTAQAAVASTWRKSDGSMLFEKPEDYDPAVET